MNNLEVLITSVHNRDKLVAEIWFDEMMVAEINQNS